MSQRIEALEAWSEATGAAVAGRMPGDNHAIWPAFSEMVNAYGVPPRMFQEVIAGQRQDLESPAFHTFAELRDYCYRVAGVVGVASIHVWGFEGGERAEALAVDRGIAFQLTNILRTCARMPKEGGAICRRQELEAAGLSMEDLLAGRAGERFDQFIGHQIEQRSAFL